jgi:hypothetical protein
MVTIVATGTPSYTLTLNSDTWSGTNDANVTGNGTATLTVTAAGIAAFTSKIGITDAADVCAGFTFTVRDAVGNTTTLQTFSIVIDVPPAVTANPANQAVALGQTATFTAAASGRPAPGVQWQVSTDGGATWAAIIGATSPGLTVTNVQEGQNGDEYRAVFSNPVGSATTAAATLFVQADLTAETAVTIGPFNASTKQQVVTLRNKGPIAYGADRPGVEPPRQRPGHGRQPAGRLHQRHVRGRPQAERRPVLRRGGAGGRGFNPGQTLSVTLQLSAKPLSYTTNVLLGL